MLCKYILLIYLHVLKLDLCAGIYKPKIFCTKCKVAYPVLKYRDGFTPDFSGLNGVTLKISCGTTSHTMTDIRENPATKHWSLPRSLTKYSVEYLSSKYNFTPIFVPSSTRDFGKKLANGSWTGVIGDISSGRAQIGCLLSQSFQRIQEVSFSFPVLYMGITFATGLPGQEYTWKSIYKPLHISVWLSIGASALFLMCVLKQLTNCYKKLEKVNKKQSQSKGFYLFSALLEQDGFPEPGNNHGIRIILAFWMLFSIVLGTAYRSKLVSLISFPVLEMLPDTFEQLADFSAKGFPVTLNDAGGSSLLYFKTSNNTALKTLVKHMDVKKNQKECIDHVVGSNSQHVCIMYNVIAENIIDRYFGGVSSKQMNVELHDSINTSPVGLVYPIQSPHALKFDWGLSAASAFGITEKWKSIDSAYIRMERLQVTQKEKKELNEMNTDSGHTPLKIKNFIGTFYLFVVGFAASSVAFLLEAVSKFRVVFVNGLKRISCLLFKQQDESIHTNLFVTSVTVHQLILKHKEVL